MADAAALAQLWRNLSTTQKVIMNGGRPRGMAQHGSWQASYRVLDRLGLRDMATRTFTPLGDELRAFLRERDRMDANARVADIRRRTEESPTPGDTEA